jgi:16S rRNA (uracil1498-N3)-methyltransferase
MREPRVFVATPLAGRSEVLLPDQAAEHVARVLRLRAGASVVLFDGTGGEYAAELATTGRDGVRATLGAWRAIECESPLRVTLLQALARGEKMDLVVQKATELGVARIVPVAAERSVVQLDGGRAERRVEHWRAVAISACEQCGRNRLPELEAASPLAEALRRLDADNAAAARLWLEPGAERSLVAAAAGQRELVLLVGPEGGFSPAEGDLAQRAGFRAASLGPRVLRTETAALAALAALGATEGDLL